MRKLVFGMIAVGCLQAGFLFYNSADNERAAMRTYSVVADPQFQENDAILSNWPRAEVVPTRPQVKVIPTTIKQRMVVAPSYQQAVYRRSIVVRSNVSKEKGFPVKTSASNVVFASNVIRYDDSLRLDKPRNKRSLASKTFSVIKKPYDWLKAIGSKLN